MPVSTAHPSKIHHLNSTEVITAILLMLVCTPLLPEQGLQVQVQQEFNPWLVDTIYNLYNVCFVLFFSQS